MRNTFTVPYIHFHKGWGWYFIKFSVPGFSMRKKLDPIGYKVL